MNCREHEGLVQKRVDKHTNVRELPALVDDRAVVIVERSELGEGRRRQESGIGSEGWIIRARRSVR